MVEFYTTVRVTGRRRGARPTPALRPGPRIADLDQVLEHLASRSHTRAA
jgi:hypothetical protein